MIQRLRNSQFVKNVALLLSGNVIGQLIPILASVLLTRLYSPNDFAVLAYFLTITGIVSVIASGISSCYFPIWVTLQWFFPLNLWGYFSKGIRCNLS